MRIVRHLAAAAGIGLLGAALASQAMASGADRVDLTYRVFVGGIPVVEVDTRTTIDGERYRMDGLLRTVGMWESLFKARMISRVDGRFTGSEAAARPLLYQTRYDGEVGRKRSINVTFDETGASNVEVIPPNADDNRAVVEPEFLLGTIDPASAALLATGADDGSGLCTREFKVFDGRRRYDVAFENKGPDEVHGFEERFFTGAATHCVINYRRVKGFDPDWERSQAKKFPNQVDIWFARLDGMARPVPVKVQVKTDYGVIVAQLIAHRTGKTDNLLEQAVELPPPDRDKMGG